MTDLCEQICTDCAGKTPDARIMPKGHVCGWWVGVCDACGIKTHVISVRDYRYPKIKIGAYKE